MTTQPAQPASAYEPPRYCRGCGYNLRGLSAARCPECGRIFNPEDPVTFRQRPMRYWVAPLKRAILRTAIVLFMLLLVVSPIWTWYYLGWRSEQQALAALDDPSVDYEPIVPPWLSKPFGPAGFAFDRVAVVRFWAQPAIKDLSPLTRLQQLHNAYICETPLTDLSPLASLPRLERLWLVATDISDLTPLAKCPQLTSLQINEAGVTDVSPLAGLTKGASANKCYDFRGLMV